MANCDLRRRPSMRENSQGTPMLQADALPSANTVPLSVDDGRRLVQKNTRHVMALNTGLLLRNINAGGWKFTRSAATRHKSELHGCSKECLCKMAACASNASNAPIRRIHRY